MTLPKPCRNRPNGKTKPMKIALIFATLLGAFLLNSCADTSLLTDEDYNRTKGPAPFSPDFSGVLPDPEHGRPAGGY